MRYEVRLVDGKLGKEDDTRLATNIKSNVFWAIGRAKKFKNEYPYNEYSAVAVYDNGLCVAKVNLY